MDDKYRSLAKDTIIFTIGSIGTKIILFFLVPLYTNYMTSEEYGISELVFTYSQLMVPFFSLIAYDAVLRFGLAKQYNRADVALSGVFFLIFTWIVSLCSLPVFNMLNSISEWKWFLVLYIPLYTSWQLGINYLKVNNKNKIFALVCIVQTALLGVANIILVAMLGRGIRGYLEANISSLLISSIIVTIISGIVCDAKNGKINKPLMSEMLKYSVPLIFNNVSWWIINSSDKIMIEALIGDAALLGLYTVATKIPSIVNLIISIFSQAWGLSTIKEIESTNDTLFISNVFKYYSLVTFGAGIFLNCIIKLFMSIYVGPDFRGAWVYAPLLIAGAVFYAISSFVASLYSAIKKTTNSMWTTIICAAINIGINFCLIPSLKVWGAVIGTIIAFMVAAFIRLYDVRKYLSFRFDSSVFFINCFVLVSHAILVALDLHVLIISTIAGMLYIIINKATLAEMIHSISNRIKDLTHRQ